jgi:hypothetical protein
LTTSTMIEVRIEGRPFALEDREYTGAELRLVAGLLEKVKLVREEEDGTETAIPPGQHIRPKPGDNFFVAVRFRRG